MQVILLDKIAKLGDLGDSVNVKAGYGRNYLLPKGKAMLATKENLAIIEEQKAKLIEKMEESKSKAVKKGELLSELTYQFLQVLARKEIIWFSGNSRYMRRDKTAFN